MWISSSCRIFALDLCALHTIFAYCLLVYVTSSLSEAQLLHYQAKYSSRSTYFVKTCQCTGNLTTTRSYFVVEFQWPKTWFCCMLWSHTHMLTVVFNCTFEQYHHVVRLYPCLLCGKLPATLGWCGLRYHAPSQSCIFVPSRMYLWQCAERAES